MVNFLGCTTMLRIYEPPEEFDSELPHYSNSKVFESMESQQVSQRPDLEMLQAQFHRWIASAPVDLVIERFTKATQKMKESQDSLKRKMEKSQNPYLAIFDFLAYVKEQDPSIVERIKDCLSEHLEKTDC